MAAHEDAVIATNSEMAKMVKVKQTVGFSEGSGMSSGVLWACNRTAQVVTHDGILLTFKAANMRHARRALRRFVADVCEARGYQPSRPARWVA